MSIAHHFSNGSGIDLSVLEDHKDNVIAIFMVVIIVVLVLVISVIVYVCYVHRKQQAERTRQIQEVADTMFGPDTSSHPPPLSLHSLESSDGDDDEPIQLPPHS
jgi:hypothetical protein